MRAAIVLPLAGALTHTASIASAEPVGSRHDAVFGIERAFGMYSLEVRQEERNGRDSDADFTEFGLGWGIPGTTPHTIPRLAFDYFVVEHLSVGGSLAYASRDDHDRDGSDDPSIFLFAPRVGWAIELGSAFTFWPRGGFTYHSIDAADENGFALTAEAMFVASPVPHFGFLFGPAFDWSFTGERGNRDRRYRVLGVSAGLVGWL